jgi:hypothetical protein
MEARFPPRLFLVCHLSAAKNPAARRMRTPCWILHFAQNDKTPLLALSLAVVLLSGCRLFAPRPTTVKPAVAPLPAGALVPSPRLIIGRVIAIDAERRFAFVELASDAPAGSMAEGSELIARTIDLRETARMHASRYVRGRTLGTNIVAGQPSPGDEVVWLAP